MARRMACPEIEKICSVTNIFGEIFLVEYLFEQKSWQKRECPESFWKKRKCGPGPLELSVDLRNAKKTNSRKNENEIEIYILVLLLPLPLLSSFSPFRHIYTSRAGTLLPPLPLVSSFLPKKAPLSTINKSLVVVLVLVLVLLLIKFKV